MRRVVITGLGAITPIGQTVADFWRNLVAGKRGIAPITHFDTADFDVKLAGEVQDFDGASLLGKKESKRLDLYCQYGLVAAQEAVAQAGLAAANLDSRRFGVIVGTGIGGMTTFANQVQVLNTKGPKRVSPFFVPMIIPNLLAGNLSIAFQAQGVSETIITACASATNAIGEAFTKIRQNQADVMLTGGSEAAICPMGIAGFQSLGALSTSTDPLKASIPFDAKRHGFVMGEGSGMLILEELTHAEKRGATILAEVVGYGATSDAYHITAPSVGGTGAAAAMEQALTDAQITAAKVGYINAHGTSTVANDKEESAAILKVFGDQASKVAVSSTKSMTGHLLGAAGGIEAIACVQTLQTGIAHGTMGLGEKDPACPLDYLANEARQVSPQYCLSNSFGFGGHNAVLAFKKWED